MVVAVPHCCTAAVDRGLKKWERVTAPVLVPLYALMMFLIVYPAKYWFLTKVRQKAKEGENDWGTRGQAEPHRGHCSITGSWLRQGA
ncbi:hypothetical protein [Streptomyces sp. NPDC003697]